MPSALLVPLPERPSREQLRGAVAALAGLAAMGHAEAQRQHTAVRALMLAMFPKRREGGGSPGLVVRPRKVGKSSLICGSACMGPCGRCKGSGHGPTVAGDFSWLRCFHCGGEGVIRLAADQIAYIPLHGRPRRIRGDFAHWGGLFGVGGVAPHGARSHTRGYAGGMLLGRLRGIEVEALITSRERFDAADVSAECEAQARKRLAEFLEEFEARAARGRRLLGSRRDRGVLTEGQQRRAKSHTRVRRYQRALARKARLATRLLERKHDAALEGLRALGLDVTALLAVSQTAVNYPAALMRSERRKALPA